MYDGLSQFLGPDAAARTWNYTRSNEFASKYPAPELDSNGEPTVEWTVQNLNLVVKAVQTPDVLIDETSFSALPQNPTYEDVEMAVQKLIDVATKNPDKIYYVRMGDLNTEGTPSYMPSKADLPTWLEAFYDAQLEGKIPSNVRFGATIQQGLNLLSSQTSIIQEGGDLSSPGAIQLFNEQVLEVQRRAMYIPISDSNGNPTGQYMSAEQQQATMDAIMYQLNKILDADDKAKALPTMARIMAQFESARKAYALRARGKKVGAPEIDALSEEDALVRNGLMSDILNSWPSVMKAFEQHASFFGIDMNLPSQAKMWSMLSDVRNDLQNLSEDEANLDLFIQELHDKEGWQDVSVEVDPMDTASGRMKMFLSTIEQSTVDEKGNILIAKGMLGLPQVYNLEDIFEETMQELTDKEPVYANFKRLLLESGKPSLIRLATRLEATSEQIRREFVKVFSKHHHTFKMVLFQRTQNGIVATPIDTNQANATRMVINQWQQNQKTAPIVTESSDGTLVINKELAGELLSKIRDKGYDRIKLAREILDAHGIVLPEAALVTLLNNTSGVTKGSRFAGNLEQQFGITQKGEPTGIFSALVTPMVQDILFSEGEVVLSSEEQTITPLKLGNPLYNESSALSFLADLASKYSKRLYASSFRNIKGKSTWAYSMNSHEAVTVRKLLADPSFRSQYNQDVFTRKAWLLPQFANGNLKLEYMGGVRNRRGQDYGAPREEMSEREQMATSLWLFQNRGQNTATLMDQTKADKSKRSPMLSGVIKIPIQNTTVFSPQVYAAIYDTIRSEADRIVRVTSAQEQGNPFTDAAYNRGGQYFYLTPEFNFDYLTVLRNKGVITDEEFGSIWIDRGVFNSAAMDLKSQKTAIKKVIDWMVQDMTASTLNDWLKAGITSTNDPSGVTFDTQYLKNILNIYGLVQENNEFYRLTGEIGEPGRPKPRVKIPVTEALELINRHAAMDYAVHYYLFNASMSQLVSGDPAQNYKIKEKDESRTMDFQRVAATLIDYVKRLAKDVAPGQDPSWTNGPAEQYQVISLSDVKTAAKYLARYDKAYGDITSTDAQELTTVREHLYVQFAMGLIPKSTYEEMIAIVDEGIRKNGGYYEFTNPAHLQIIMQPMKPVYVGARYENGARFIDYIKSSSYPLYPPMTRGTEIDGLRMAMEGKMTGKVLSGHIARAHFASAKKVGLPINMQSAFTADGTFTGNITTPTTLTREGFRIQQEVPYDESKDMIRIVSQANKLLVEGLQGREDLKFTVEGYEQVFTGPELAQHKEDIRIEMFEKAYREFSEKIGASLDDRGRLVLGKQDKIIGTLLEEATSRDYPINDIVSLLIRNSEGNLAIPLLFNSSADKFESLLMAMNKKVAMIKMPGKSYVQASPTGHRAVKKLKDLSVDERNKIVYTQRQDKNGNWKTFDPSKGLKGIDMVDGEVQPAQVFLSFSFLEAGRAMGIDQFTKQDENGVTVIDPEKLSPRLLRLLGFRIPNQGHNSMLPIEIAGFIPEDMGDLMIVPDTVTVQMGSDFDVDKLFVYRLPYTRFEDGSYDLDESNEAVVDYFNIHWSVLTHPEMFKRIIAPLDKADLKEEADMLDAVLAEKTDLPRRQFQGTSQILDYMAQKDAKGLVASTSLTSTFNALVQSKKVTLARRVGSKWEAATFSGFRDEFTGDKINASEISGYGTTLYSSKDGDQENASVRTKGDNIAIQQSEAVDYTKNRVIDRVNLNQFTYKASAALSLLQDGKGKAFNVKYNARLLMQPVIQEFSSLMASGNDQLSENTTSNLNERVINELAGRYRDLATEALLQEKQGRTEEEAIEMVNNFLKLEESYSPQMLLSVLKAPRNSQFYMNQLRLLEIFAELDKLGQEIQSIQGLINQDTRGAGPSILHAINQQKRANEKEGSYLMGWEQLLEDSNGKRTEIGTLATMTTETVPHVYSPLLPYNKLFGLYEAINAQMGRKLTVNEMRDVTREFRAYAYGVGTEVMGIKDPHKERIRLLFSTRDHASLPKRVEEMRRQYPNNTLLGRIQTTLAEKRGEPDTLWVQAAQLTRADEYTVVRDWMDMLTSSDEQLRTIAEDLVRYVFVTGGRSDVRSLARFVPASYLAAIGFGAKLDGIDLTAIPNNFLYQWMQHHANAVRHIPEKVATGTTFVTPSLESIITGAKPEFSDILITNEVDGELVPAFPVFVSQWDSNNLKWKLFVKTSEGVDGTVTYSVVDTLGDKGVMEYNHTQVAATRSIFQDNRVAVMPVVDPDIVVNRTEKDQSFYTKWYPKANYNEAELLERTKALLDADEFASPYKESIALFLNMGAQMAAGNLRFLEEMKEYLRINFGVDSSGFPVVRGVSLNVSSLLDEKGRPVSNIGGTYSPSSQGIFLNTVYFYSGNRTLSSEVVAHEFSHHFTATAIGVVDLIWSSAAQNDRPDILEGFIQRFPQMYAHMQELDRLLIQAREAYLETLSTEAEKNVIRDYWAQGGLQIPGIGNSRLNYLLSNIAEFTTGAMTNVAMMNFLNGVKDDKRSSLLSKILDKFVDILRTIAASIGIEVAPGSNLEGTLKTISGVMSLVTSPEYNSLSENWTTENPAAAERLKDQGFKINASDFGVYQLVNPRHPHAQMAPSDQGIIQRSITRLQEQRQEILDRMTNLKDPAVYARKQAVLSMTEDAIRELKTTTTPDVLATIASKQMQYVDKILADPNASVNDVMMAWQLTDAWINIGDLLFPDAQAALTSFMVPDYVKGMEEEARLRRTTLLNLKMQAVFTTQSTIGLTDRDFNQDLVDMSTANLLMRSADHAKSKLTQQVTLFLQNAGRRRDEAILRYVRDELATLDKKMDTARKSRNMNKTQFYNLFFQENETETAWGVVQEFSYDWFAADKTLRRELEAAVREINNKTWTNQGAYKAALDDAWGKFHRAKVQQSYTLPAHELFDASGKQIVTDFSGPLRDANGRPVKNFVSKAIYQNLEKALGKKKADELVKQAGEKYKQYLEDKDAHDSDIDAAVLDGRLTLAEGVSAKAGWVAANSPAVYTTARYATTATPNLSVIPVDALKYVVEVPRKDYQNGVFYDTKWETIQQSKDLKEIHDTISEMMNRFTGYLPLYMQREIGPNFLPIVQREIITQITNASALKGWVSDTVINALTASPYEESNQGNKQRNIPVNYVTTKENKNYTTPEEMKARQEELGERSRDITRLLELFGISAMHYKYFSGVRDVVEMGQTLVTEINNQRKLATQTRYQDGKVTDNTKSLENTVKALNYTMDALMYKRARDLEVNLGAKLYSLNPIKQAQISRKVKTLERQLIDLEKEKGTMSQQEYEDKKKDLQEDLAQYEGRTMFLSKGADVLMNITQLKALAYNPFSAAANLSFGLVSAMTHANGRVDFDHSSFWKAFAMVLTHASKKAATVSAWSSPTAKKIFNLLERTGVMADIVDSQYGKTNIPDLKNKWKSRLSPYQMMRSSDYFMRALNTVAYMIHQKVDVTLPDGTKTQVTAWEAFDDNGDFKYQDPAWNGADEEQRTAWEAFRNRAIRVNSTIMGNMDRNSPIWTKKYMLGRLIAQFRLSWLGEGFGTRFEHEKYDSQMGRIVKGRWRTYMDLGAGRSFLTVGKQLLSLIPGMKINPFDVELKDGRNMMGSDVDIENMRRNFAELGFAMTLLAAIAILKFAKEDDDENKAKLQLLINMLTRTEQDIWFYASPDAFNTVFNRAIPAINTLNDYQKAVSAMGKIMFDDDYEWEQFILAMTRAGLPIPQAALYNKIKYMTERDLGAINN